MDVFLWASPFLHWSLTNAHLRPTKLLKRKSAIAVALATTVTKIFDEIWAQLGIELLSLLVTTPSSNLGQAYPRASCIQDGPKAGIIPLDH